MEFKGFKINIIILVIVLVIGLFFSAQYLFKVYNVDKPIKNEILALKGIKDVSIIDNSDQKDLLIDFHSGIDFYKSYQDVNQIMQDKLGSKSGNIIISKNDQENEELDDIYYKLHYAIYQGINTGYFVEMEKNVETIVGMYELDSHKIWVDNNAIYIQLDNNNKSLYKRISYNNIILDTEGGGSIG